MKSKRKLRTVPVMVRTPEDVVADADAVAASLTEKWQNRTSRADVFRMALVRGLRDLKKEMNV